MRHLDNDTLAAFVAVYDHGSFTAAAEQLGKTQAAVSIMLSRLEKHLGQRLLERSRQGITLTPAGEKLIGYARQMRMLEEEALSALGCYDARTRIRIGMPDDYLGTVGAALIENFSQRNPQLQVEIVSDFSFKLQKSLEEGHLDLAIVTRQPGQEQGSSCAMKPSSGARPHIAIRSGNRCCRLCCSPMAAGRGRRCWRRWTRPGCAGASFAPLPT
ncbi:LysR family transcriptional regulator [Sodalis ligni]|nr:LysR family transcriptional regulator [Sodalis ligni]QWA13340.1 LysR family transcriptional regulator [Sodalis ligni]